MTSLTECKAYIHVTRSLCVTLSVCTEGHKSEKHGTAHRFCFQIKVVPLKMFSCLFFYILQAEQVNLGVKFFYIDVTRLI